MTQPGPLPPPFSPPPMPTVYFPPPAAYPRRPSLLWGFVRGVIASMVVSLFAAAQWLEAQSLDRARKAIGELIDLAPASVLIRDAAGERPVDLDRVDPGALMIVKPGEKLALDGIVRSGRSDV